MVIIDEKYKFEIELLKNGIIPKNRINQFLLLILQNILYDIKNKNKDEMDVGDIFPIAILNAQQKYKYKLKKEVYDFFLFLGSYKDDPFNNGREDERHNVDYVEKVTKKLMLKIS